MRLQKHSRRFLIGVVVMTPLLLGVAAALVTMPDVAVARQEAPVYYCPMHPSYTSDHPGDCPICNMRLVKREPQQGRSQSPAKTQTAKDICYMHQCPMGHDGKPCPMMVVAKEGETVTCPICGKHVAEKAGQSMKKILYWTDPMLPGYKSDKPGTSPMGMDLVPVYEESGVSAEAGAPAGYTPILVTPQKQQLIGVKTAVVERRHLTKTIRTVGTIAHDPELYQAEAEYLQAVKALAHAKEGGGQDITEQAQHLVDSAQIRLRHLGLSDELIQEIAGGEGPERSLLYTTPGEPVWMYAKVYEYELSLVHVGQALTAETSALAGETFHGTIRAIDPRIEAMTRTTRIRAKLDDPNGHLTPEMYVNVAIAVDLGEALALPEEAVFDTGAKRIVFVDKGQGLFEPRDVTVGAKADGVYEAKDGVQEGERVVTSGNFLIDSESRLKAALEGMSGGGEHQHGQ